MVDALDDAVDHLVGVGVDDEDAVVGGAKRTGAVDADGGVNAPMLWPKLTTTHWGWNSSRTLRSSPCYWLRIVVATAVGVSISTHSERSVGQRDRLPASP